MIAGALILSACIVAPTLVGVGLIVMLCSIFGKGRV
jgi:hypothetical protein